MTRIAAIWMLLTVSLGVAAHGHRQGEATTPGHQGGADAARESTPGWSMMTPEERQKHHEKMRGMRGHGECMEYMHEHHRHMESRAREKGTTLDGKDPGPYCEGMKKR